MKNLLLVYDDDILLQYRGVLKLISSAPFPQVSQQVPLKIPHSDPAKDRVPKNNTAGCWCELGSLQEGENPLESILDTILDARL